MLESPEMPPMRHPEDGIDAARMRGAWLEVDSGAIAHNVRALRAWLPTRTRLMAVVKADGYGHGALEVARSAVAAGADWLGVATVAEGLRLREAGLSEPMLLLGLLVPAAYAQAIAADLQITVSTVEALHAIAAAAHGVGRTARVHLKIDSGMTRVGVAPMEVRRLHEVALELPELAIAGLETHLASAEAEDPAVAEAQLRRYEEAISQLPVGPDVLRHAANSAGTLFFTHAHHDMVRPGLLLYGIPPRPDAALPFSLKRAMRVHATLTQVRDVEAGTRVGYGGTYTTPAPARLAILPVGYADGLPRSLSNGHPVLVGGHACPIVGSVSMDQVMVDVTAVGARVGDAAVLMGTDGGRRVEVEDWADRAGTIPYEIICGLGRRLPRVYLS